MSLRSSGLRGRLSRGRPRCQLLFEDFFFAVFLLVFLLDVFDAFFAVFFADARALFFGGTFLPSRRASDRPMAIACLRLLTLRPEPPLFNVPALRFFIARPTLADAPLEYLRAALAMK